MGFLPKAHNCLKTKLEDSFEMKPLFARNAENDVFRCFPDDEILSLSANDRRFLKIMERTVQDETGHLQVPLPFKSENPYFPDNRRAIFMRQQTTLKKLSSNLFRL